MVSDTLESLRSLATIPTDVYDTRLAILFLLRVLSIHFKEKGVTLNCHDNCERKINKRNNETK